MVLCHNMGSGRINICPFANKTLRPIRDWQATLTMNIKYGSLSAATSVISTATRHLPQPHQTNTSQPSPHQLLTTSNTTQVPIHQKHTATTKPTDHQTTITKSTTSHNHLHITTNYNHHLTTITAQLFYNEFYTTITTRNEPPFPVPVQVVTPSEAWRNLICRDVSYLFNLLLC